LLRLVRRVDGGDRLAGLHVRDEELAACYGPAREGLAAGVRHESRQPTPVELRGEMREMMREMGERAQLR
jgi:hypothetical protein